MVSVVSLLADVSMSVTAVVTYRVVSVRVFTASVVGVETVPTLVVVTGLHVPSLQPSFVTVCVVYTYCVVSTSL